MTDDLCVRAIKSAEAAQVVIEHHYLHRRPPTSYAFGLFKGDTIKGVLTFGVPASRHLILSASPENPNDVIELNRLWISDDMPKNTASAFVAKVLKMLPERIVVSYADTSVGHAGYVYRASNFNYSGWTDMERKTPRYDYVVPGKHSRDAFRSGNFTRVRRKPKVKYWIVSGTDKRERRRLDKRCGWPKLCWKAHPPPVAAQGDNQ